MRYNFNRDHEQLDATQRQAKQLAVTDFLRYVSAMHTAYGASGQGTAMGAADVFEQRWPQSPHLTTVRSFSKSIGASTSGLLQSSPGYLAQAFFGSVEPFTVKGRAGLRRVPFNITVNVAATPFSFKWKGEGLAASSVTLTMTPDTLPARTASGIFGITKELIRLNAPGAMQFFEAEMQAGLIKFLDEQFLDPSVSEVANVSPASITNGLTPIGSVGNPASDIRLLIREYLDGGGNLETGVFVLSTANALALRLSGHSAFEGLTREGGELAGAPALASAAAGDQLILMDTARIRLADDLEGDVDVSTQATVEMTASPSQSGVSGSGAQMVSLFQSGLAAIKVDRVMNWSKSEGAVAVMDGFDYITDGSPS